MIIINKTIVIFKSYSLGNISFIHNVSRMLFHILNSLDVNECLDTNVGCDQICVNKEGSFECKCNVGFTLEVDKKSCSGISIFENIFTIFQ